MSAPRYKETYETRMLNELTARVLELEEVLRDHLLDCQARTSTENPGVPAAFQGRSKADLPIVRPRCELCENGIPHTAGPDCDSARRDMVRRARGEI